MPNIGLIFLAIYLLLVGVIGLFSINLGALAIIVPICAIVASIAIFFRR